MMNTLKITDLKAGQITTVQLDWIDFSDKTFCIRQKFEVESLMGSLKKVSQLHPVVVRINKNTLQIVSGWRRVYALAKLGIRTVLVSVIDRPDIECRYLATSENLDRQTMSAAETYHAIDDLIRSGANVKDLMKHFTWCKSYAYSVNKVAEFPQIVSALNDDKFTAFSTAAELAEQLSRKKVKNHSVVFNAIKKTCDHTWPVKDIGYFLGREIEISQRVAPEPTASESPAETFTKPKSFKSNWRPTWDIERLTAEHKRFKDEILKIEQVMLKKVARTKKPNPVAVAANK